MWTKFVFMWNSPTIEPRHCGEVPSKSTWSSSPVFVTVATMAMVSSEMPSSSTWSVNDQVPSGSSAIARPREALGVVEEVRDERVVLPGPADPFDERQQLALPDPGRGHLGAKVAHDRLGLAYRLLEQTVDGLVGLSPFVELRGRDAQPLLMDLRIGEALASGNASPDVRVVADGADVPKHAALLEHRPEDVDVGEVLGPFVRVVGDEEVAGLDLVPEPGEAAGERGRHAAEMDRVAHAPGRRDLLRR